MCGGLFNTPKPPKLPPPPPPEPPPPVFEPGSADAMSGLPPSSQGKKALINANVGLGIPTEG